VNIPQKKLEKLAIGFSLVILLGFMVIFDGFRQILWNLFWSSLTVGVVAILPFWLGPLVKNRFIQRLTPCRSIPKEGTRDYDQFPTYVRVLIVGRLGALGAVVDRSGACNAVCGIVGKRPDDLQWLE
jgi:hypothetical protein